MLSDAMVESLKEAEPVLGKEMVDDLIRMEMSITDAEEREMLLEGIVEDTKLYISFSPAPHPALVALIDAQLGALSEDWAMTRAELLECVREPL